MSKSVSDWVTDQICMLPFHITGLSAAFKAVEVVGDLAGGNKPKVSDVVGAAGLLDADGVDVDTTGTDRD